jgi:hypothetical protein
MLKTMEKLCLLNLAFLASSVVSAATIEYTFETAENVSGSGVDLVYIAPDSNDFGAGITISDFTLEDRDTEVYSRFVAIGGESIEAAVGSGSSDLLASFTMTIDDTVSVDLTSLIFDSSARWTSGGSIDDVFVDFYITVGSDQSSIVTFDWLHDGDPNYQTQDDNTVTMSSLTGVDLTGLSDTTVTFTWELGTDRNNTFATIAQGLDDIVLTGSVSPVPEASSYALIAGCFGLAFVMVRRR